MKSGNEDRNFDDLAERFANRIYGSRKGEIRQAVIWRDLQSIFADHKPMRILDVGGGLGHFSIKFAEQGHTVCYNDISPVMTEKAKHLAAEKNVIQKISWYVLPYQQLIHQIDAGYDLILCHAVLEWLQQPEMAISALQRLLTESGVLSLCFYNPAGMIYRNLIRGNFNRVTQQNNYQADKGSLTPDNPCSMEQVQNWLNDNRLQIDQVSGIRVFSDYVVEKRGGLQAPESVLQMELEYSHQSPYKWMGRYLHVVAKPRF